MTPLVLALALAQTPTTTPTGFPTKDKSLTIDRCIKTSWSYSGCTAVFPQQARASLAAACVDPKTEYPAIICAHLARLQLRGVGGPVDRKGAIDTLSRLCAARDRVACADLGLTLAWTNAPDGKKYLAPGCEEEPQKSPIGVCMALKSVLSPTATRRTITVTSSSLKDVKKGSPCTLGVAPNGADACFVHVTCGDRVLYDGETPCTAADGGGENMTSGEDGDPAMSFDGRNASVELHEEASATEAAWSLTGKLSR